MILKKLEFLFFVVVSLFVLISADKKQEKQEDKIVDFIVVGAGAAGSALAHRLAENGQYEVLLLEAGEEPLYYSKIPYFTCGPWKGKMDWHYSTERQENACLNYEDQKILWPRGKALGGSTAINAMFYTRGDKKDYNLWKALGNEGWDYEDVLPFFKKLEDYRAPLISQSDKEYLGTGGPVIISRPSLSTPIAKAFIEAGKLMGYLENNYNTEKLTGFANPVFTMVNGSRWTTYDAYLKSIVHWKNIHIIPNALVTKILLDDNKKASGVIYEIDGKPKTLKCRKEVIISAGAANSPQLLMLSGIGPIETLEKFKIPVIVDLQGVGQHLQDHVATGGVIYTFPHHIGINHHFMVNPETMELWETKREGPLTVPLRSEGLAFINSKYALPDGTYPDIELLIMNWPVANLGLKFEATKPFIPDDTRTRLIVIPIALRPKSLGYLTLRSSDPHDPPIIQPNYFSEKYDVEVLVEGMKFAHELMQQEPFRKLGAKPVKKKALGCDSYEHFSDDYFRCFIRHYGTHLFHPVGTCRMGPRDDKTAVVDNRLKVYGVQGLRVIDASIMPELISAHTMAPSIMIGEKGAAMILEDWKDRREEL